MEISSITALRHVASDEASGSEVELMRMRGTGIFQDPNDLCSILVFGVITSIYVSSTQKNLLTKLLWLLPTGIFLPSIIFTYSRGGLLSLISSIFVYLNFRYGLKKTILGMGLILPVLLAVAGGRQKDIQLNGDSGQDRLQLWAQGFAIFREAPLFGIGQNTFGDLAGLVAHNSYVHAFAELGLLGGCLFLGMLGSAIQILIRLKSIFKSYSATIFTQFQPFLLAIIVSYGVAILTLSRNYVSTTFLILGLVTAYQRLTESLVLSATGSDLVVSPVTWRWLGRVFLGGMLFLVIFNILVKIFVRF